MTPLARIWSKTSFALTLLRVLDDKDRFQRLFIWFVIASMHVLSILYIVMAWRSICETADHENGEAVGRIKGPCVPLATVLAVQISNVALSAFMDFALALFPWLIIWKLQMRVQEKIGTAVAMSLGILAGVFAILQIKSMITLAGPGYSEWKLAQLSIVASAEPTITIVAASIPVLRILLRDLYHKPTLVEVRALGVSSKADLRRTSTRIDSVPDLPHGIMHKTEVDIEYSRQSSYSVRNIRGAGYELEEWKIGSGPTRPGTAK
ncbi:Integral membrane family protein [Apiospora sp. TS-2023a]